MGGTHGFGPVVAEVDEPPFHADWERRVFAMTIALGASGAWNIDMSRSAREDRAPQEYLGMSYYQLWLAGLERLVAEHEPKRVLRRRRRRGHAHPRRLRGTAGATRRRVRGRRPRAHGQPPPAHAHAAPALRPRQGRHGRDRARLPRLPRQPRLRRATIRNGSTPCASPRASCGAMTTRPRSASTPSSPTSSVPDEPVFAEPWEAQAFALAVSLSERGVFTWSEWTEAVAAAPEQLGYYERWLDDARAAGGREGPRRRGGAGPLPARLGARRRAHAARHADRAQPSRLRRFVTRPRSSSSISTTPSRSTPRASLVGRERRRPVADEAGLGQVREHGQQPRGVERRQLQPRVVEPEQHARVPGRAGVGRLQVERAGGDDADPLERDVVVDRALGLVERREVVLAPVVADGTAGGDDRLREAARVRPAPQPASRRPRCRAARCPSRSAARRAAAGAWARRS